VWTFGVNLTYNIQTNFLRHDTINIVLCAVCHGIVVHNIAAAQRFKGCTVITGSLSIEISGGCEYQLKNNYKRL